MLEQNPVNEQRSNVLLFPMKLQEATTTYLNHPAVASLKNDNNRQPCCAFPPLTLFSIDFLTRVKLFQRESNSFLWVPRKNMRSLMICSQTDRQKLCETFTGLPQDRIITFHAWITERSRGLDTLMMTKSDLVSSSECSKMWSGLGKSAYGLTVHHNHIPNKARSLEPECLQS